jgi:hypothetical protein
LNFFLFRISLKIEQPGHPPCCFPNTITCFWGRKDKTDQGLFPKIGEVF